MRIAFLAHHGGLGGASLSLLELVSGLNARELDCGVVLPRPGFLSQSCEDRNIPTLVFESDMWAHPSPLSRPRLIRKLLGHSWRALKLARALRNWRCGLLISNCLGLCEGALAAKLLGIPHIAYIREFGDLDYGLHFELGTQRSLRILSALSRRTIFNSQAVASYFEKQVRPGTGRVVYNAVTVPELGPCGVNDSLECLLVGNVCPAKGQLEAISAVGQLVRRGLSLRLTLLGPFFDEPYVDQVRQSIAQAGLENVVELPGCLPPQECYQRMAAADVILMCSRMEAFGRVTVEAMKLGKAVVGAASGGTRELIQDGRTGLLYAPGEPLDLADKIQRLMNDRGLLERLGRQARLETQGSFTTDSYAEAVLAVIREALG